MARPKLSSPDQPFFIRLPLRVFEAAASLRLAVLVIFGSAGVLGYATFVESWYGTDAVQFGVYGTWWFALLLGLLGLNVLCAAAIRFPWKKYQTGFVITHAGIIVLLVGCLQSRLGGIDAQMPIFEGGTGHTAYEDTQHFELKIYPAFDRSATADGSSSARLARSVRTIRIPFRSGPFNWEDYTEKLPALPWTLSPRDRGVVYDRDNIRLEVLDYLADSSREPAPPLRVRARPAAAEKDGSTAQWSTADLSMQGTGSDSPHGQMGLGGREELPSGHRLVFWVAANDDEAQAFLNSQPEGPLGEHGQVVLFARGRRFVFNVDELQQQKRLPLGNSGLEVVLNRFDDKFLGVVLLVYAPGSEPQRMVLLADHPEFNQQDHENAVYGSYWFDATKRPAEAADSQTADVGLHPERPRIDILQAGDRLHYRAWRSPQLETIAELPTGGERVVAFAKSDAAISFYVEQFVAQSEPGWLIKPKPFSKRDKGLKERRARVRLAVDGRSEEFWLEGLGAMPFGPDPSPSQRRVVQAEGRRVAVTMPWDQIDVGFRLLLHKFDRRLDPGTSQASHYSSLVDLLPREGSDNPLQEQVRITLNEPVNFSDPRTGRSYRLYQEAFRGPWRPGDGQFEQLLAMTGREDLPGEIFMSWLTVNYDPGRGLKYFGSLMIVAGIATMFYMRAYFFRPPAAAREVAPGARQPTAAAIKSKAVARG